MQLRNTKEQFTAMATATVTTTTITPITKSNQYFHFAETGSASRASRPIGTTNTAKIR